MDSLCLPPPYGNRIIQDLTANSIKIHANVIFMMICSERVCVSFFTGSEGKRMYIELLFPQWRHFGSCNI
jgi:hypothetical protein